MQFLQYDLAHPYPKNRLFTVITFVLIALVLPVLVIVNIITVGHELVPSLRQDFQQNDTIPLLWTTTLLAPLLRRKAPRCQPKDFGRGDTFRLSPSLFEYKVLSSWRTNSTLKSEDEGRVEYRGGSFDQCFVYSIRFDLSAIESTQTLTVVVSCPSFPVRAFLETRIVFALDDSKDIVGQYYGGDIDILDLVDSESQDYRRLVFAVMDVMSTDSLSTLDGSRHSWLSLSTRALVHLQEPSFTTTILVAKNGTSRMLDNDNDLGDAEVYRPTIVNLMRTVQHAVQLDLGNPGPDNIFTNPLALNNTFNANPPLAAFNARHWVDRDSFQYGAVEAPHLTFAEMLRAGVPTNITAALGNPTGLPANSTIIMDYMCPNYQARPMSSLLANVFIGTATMSLSAWAVLRFVTAMIAKRIRGPCEPCFDKLTHSWTDGCVLGVTCTCGGLPDLENTLVRCGHSHAVVASGLATGLVPPPPNFLARSNTETDVNEKGEFSGQDISIQEVPK
ncbi:transmembrane protein, putative [Rhizoctonia solani AG-3 Rhs1AP]|uniref:Transmembrane protein, putative n=1 Tax=Rhizoctonia solani AG-3 Rhs1AP TaxID=1086054 RepID=X8JM68_9AGAM|nr:transmembrane protein, putative [Rhizoctonia solani AG-3 Rhs1AP]